MKSQLNRLSGYASNLAMGSNCGAGSQNHKREIAGRVVLFCHGNAGKHTAGYLKSHEIYSKAIDAFLEDIYNEQ